jgi:hypothetical protein
VSNPRADIDEQRSVNLISNVRMSRTGILSVGVMLCACLSLSHSAPEDPFRDNCRKTHKSTSVATVVGDSSAINNGNIVCCLTERRHSALTAPKMPLDA